MKRFRTSGARRRRLRVIGAWSVGILVLAALALALVFAGSGPVRHSAVDASTTSEPFASSIGSSTTTTSSPEAPATTSTTPVAPTTTQTQVALLGDYVVVIDPGHQGKSNYNQEPVGPGSSRTKAKVSSGTKSINTGAPESQLTLAVGLKLRDSLEAQGITVIMTRTVQEIDISNVQRAQLANEAGADLFVRIHADGAGETTRHGILMLYPSYIKGWTDDIAAESKRAARIVLDSMLEATGAYDRGMIARSDLSGFNWADVPSILPEIGLMTNRTEDALLATEEYQDKLVQGLTAGILEYLGVR